METERSLVHFLPILTTLVSIPFAIVLFQRYRDRGGLHLLWWGIGVTMYGVGTLTESLTTLLGWDPLVFRLWYVSGALLGGAPLAQGTVYLLLSRRWADRLTVLLVSAVAVAATMVFLSPLNLALVEPYRLSGRVMEWTWVRLFSPFINLYAVFFLIGGALWSAYKYARRREAGGRVLGNLLIAVGAILPGIGGTFTRFGHVEVLYVTELLGLLLLYAGYRANVGSPAPAVHPNLAGSTA
jgi:hypothetical protein